MIDMSERKEVEYFKLLESSIDFGDFQSENSEMINRSLLWYGVDQGKEVELMSKSV